MSISSEHLWVELISGPQAEPLKRTDFKIPVGWCSCQQLKTDKTSTKGQTQDKAVNHFINPLCQRLPTAFRRRLACFGPWETLLAVSGAPQLGPFWAEVVHDWGMAFGTRWAKIWFERAFDSKKVVDDVAGKTGDVGAFPGVCAP